MYTVTKFEEGYTVVNNGKPVVLADVGIVKFATVEEAERYIRYVALAKEQMRAGVSD